MTAMSSILSAVEVSRGSSIKRRAQHSCEIDLAIRLRQKSGPGRKKAWAFIGFGTWETRGQNHFHVGPALHREARELIAVDAAGHDDVGEEKIDLLGLEQSDRGRRI